VEIKAWSMDFRQERGAAMRYRFITDSEEKCSANSKTLIERYPKMCERKEVAEGIFVGLGA
jgi:hypothetical protein